MAVCSADPGKVINQKIIDADPSGAAEFDRASKAFRAANAVGLISQEDLNKLLGEMAAKGCVAPAAERTSPYERTTRQAVNQLRAAGATFELLVKQYNELTSDEYKKAVKDAVDTGMKKAMTAYGDGKGSTQLGQVVAEEVGGIARICTRYYIAEGSKPTKDLDTIIEATKPTSTSELKAAAKELEGKRTQEKAQAPVELKDRNGKVVRTLDTAKEPETAVLVKAINETTATWLQLSFDEKSDTLTLSRKNGNNVRNFAQIKGIHDVMENTAPENRAEALKKIADQYIDAMKKESARR